MEPAREASPATPPARGQAAPSAADRAASRRRFLRAGLVGAPLVVTLAARPAVALTGPSVGFSGNVSFFGRRMIDELEGLTPGYWKQPQHFPQWTAPYHPGYPQLQGSPPKIVYVGGTKFADVFKDAFPDKTLLEVVSSVNQLPVLDALGRHIVAALLNAAHPNIFYRFAVPTIIHLFNSTFPDGDLEGLKDLLDRENNRGEPDWM